MKYGIDSLLKILEDYSKEVRRYSLQKDEVQRTYQGDAAQEKIKECQSVIRAKTERFSDAFQTKLSDILAAVQADQENAKYLSDPGFANAIQIVSSGGGRLGSDVLKSLVRPYLDDYVARQSLAAILAQNGRDPEAIGIAEDVDALAILAEVGRNAQQTFNGWSGVDIPFTSVPTVIVHQLNRANAVLEGSYSPDAVSF